MSWASSKEFPKPLSDGVVRAADVVVTMGCGDACPIYLGKRYLNWDLGDPAGNVANSRVACVGPQGRPLFAPWPSRFSCARPDPRTGQ